MAKVINVGTRDSALAMWQTNWVVENLSRLNPEYEFRVVSMKTQGDKILDVALAKIGDKGLFTKELEVAMLEGQADMAVHSMKDLPTNLPEGLMIGCICERVDPRDVLVSREGLTLQELPQGAKIGTSSLRRCAQLLNYRSDFELVSLRGNLNTRMAKLEREQMDGIVLAAAGLERMGWAERITQRIPYEISLPAVGQGSIGIEIRENDEEIYQILQKLNHRESYLAITAERGLLRTLEGGCQIPIGAHAEVEGAKLTLKGLVASLDGKKLLRSEIEGSAEDADALGRALAGRLLEMGAHEILEEVRGACENG